MKKLITLLILGSLALMLLWGVARPLLERWRDSKLLASTGEGLPIKTTITVSGDSWLGYFVCRSNQFKLEMAKKGIRIVYKEEVDYQKRLELLKNGGCDFVVMTLDSYLSNGESTDWPGVITFVIDESFGGDAIIGGPNVNTIDDINRTGIKGTFVGFSPSEFLLRSQVTNFKLARIRNQVESFRVDGIKDAYKKLENGKADFAVLWEPEVSAALSNIKGTKVLMDTKSAQGIIIDIAVASRRIVAGNPDVVNQFTATYFQVLHQLLLDQNALLKAAADDANSDRKDALTMLSGIRFASLDDNLTFWLHNKPSETPNLVTASMRIEKILQDHKLMKSLPNDDIYALINRTSLQSLALNRTAVPPVQAVLRGEDTYYPPLTDQEWNALKKKIKGTLLEEPITFQPGSTQVPDDFVDTLKDTVQRLVHYPTYRVVVQAYVTSSGDDKEDLTLSRERALSVKRILMYECKIPDERILAEGKGAQDPPERLPDESDRAYANKTRRAKVLLVGE